MIEIDLQELARELLTRFESLPEGDKVPWFARLLDMMPYDKLLALQFALDMTPRREKENPYRD